MATDELKQFYFLVYLVRAIFSDGQVKYTVFPNIISMVMADK